LLLAGNGGWQQTEVAGKASWKPFAPTQEIIGSDDDDDNDEGRGVKWDEFFTTN
jgi:hypothetical protein